MHWRTQLRTQKCDKNSVTRSLLGNLTFRTKSRSARIDLLVFYVSIKLRHQHPLYVPRVIAPCQAFDRLIVPGVNRNMTLLVDIRVVEFESTRGGRGVLNKFPRDHAAREHYRRQRERYTVLCVRCRSKMIRTPSKVECKHKVSLVKTYYFYRVIKKINFGTLKLKAIVLGWFVSFLLSYLFCPCMFQGLKYLIA